MVSIFDVFPSRVRDVPFEEHRSIKMTLDPIPKYIHACILLMEGWSNFISLF